MSESWCEICGTQQVARAGRYFDTVTGVQQIQQECVHPSCERGCLNLGGHVYDDSRRGRPGTKCVRCGYEPMISNLLAGF